MARGLASRFLAILLLLVAATLTVCGALSLAYGLIHRAASDAGGIAAGAATIVGLVALLAGFTIGGTTLALTLPVSRRKARLDGERRPGERAPYR